GSAKAGAEMGTVIEEQLAPPDRIEVERVQGNRSRLMHDNGVGVGEFRNLPGEAVGDDRALLPLGVVHHLGTRGLCPFAKFAHIDRAVGDFCRNAGLSSCSTAAMRSSSP